jgi:hypothetical protein
LLFTIVYGTVLTAGGGFFFSPRLWEMLMLSFDLDDEEFDAEVGGITLVGLFLA